MTTGTTVFFSRLSLALDFTAGFAVVVLAAFGVFFCAGADVRLAKGFFALLLAAADLDVADLDVAVLETLRLAGFEAAARFALGRLDLACIERPLTEVFDDVGRAGVRDRLMPLVTGLLIRRFKSKGQVGCLKGRRNGRELNIASPVNQRKKGSCGYINSHVHRLYSF